MVIKIDFVDGDSEAIEIDNGISYLDCFRYNNNTNCFEIRNKAETIVYTREFIKSIHLVEV